MRFICSAFLLKNLVAAATAVSAEGPGTESLNTRLSLNTGKAGSADGSDPDEGIPSKKAKSDGSESDADERITIPNERAKSDGSESDADERITIPNVNESTPGESPGDSDEAIPDESTLGHPDETIPFCVVGAGPGGIQVGHHLREAGLEYVLFEKGPTVGTLKIMRDWSMCSLRKGRRWVH
jgi:hypothetical protein